MVNGLLNITENFDELTKALNEYAALNRKITVAGSVVHAARKVCIGSGKSSPGIYQLTKGLSWQNFGEAQAEAERVGWRLKRRPSTKRDKNAGRELRMRFRRRFFLASGWVVSARVLRRAARMKEVQASGERAKLGFISLSGLGSSNPQIVMGNAVANKHAQMPGLISRALANATADLQAYIARKTRETIETVKSRHLEFRA